MRLELGKRLLERINMRPTWTYVCREGRGSSGLLDGRATRRVPFHGMGSSRRTAERESAQLTFTGIRQQPWRLKKARPLAPFAPLAFIDVCPQPPHIVGTDVVSDMAMGNLTVLKIKSIKEAGRYSDGEGLHLWVKAGGTRSWVLRIQVDGRRRDFGLGSAKSVTLADAREKASELRKMYRSGVDPTLVKAKTSVTHSPAPSFADAAISAHDSFKDAWRNPKHRAQWLATLSAYAFPYFGNIAVDEIDASHVISALQQIWLSKPETARRVKQRIGAVLDWCYAQGYRKSEMPMRAISKGLKQQTKQKSHFAALPHSEVPEVMAALIEKNTVGSLALQFLVLTAARSGEVRGAVWKEFDLENAVWTIPATRMKAGRIHIVPLSPAAAAIIKAAKGDRAVDDDEVVFPGKAGRPLSDMTLTKSLRSVTSLHATVHGFRSTFRDWAAEEKPLVSDAVVEAALAHTNPNKVEAAYRRTNYLDARKSLMDDWGSHARSR